MRTPSGNGAITAQVAINTAATPRAALSHVPTFFVIMISSFERRSHAWREGFWNSHRARAPDDPEQSSGQSYCYRVGPSAQRTGAMTATVRTDPLPDGSLHVTEIV